MLLRNQVAEKVGLVLDKHLGQDMYDLHNFESHHAVMNGMVTVTLGFLPLPAKTELPVEEIEDNVIEFVEPLVVEPMEEKVEVSEEKSYISELLGGKLNEDLNEAPKKGRKSARKTE